MAGPQAQMKGAAGIDRHTHTITRQDDTRADPRPPPPHAPRRPSRTASDSWSRGTLMAEGAWPPRNSSALRTSRSTAGAEAGPPASAAASCWTVTSWNPAAHGVVGEGWQVSADDTVLPGYWPGGKRVWWGIGWLAGSRRVERLADLALKSRHLGRRPPLGPALCGSLVRACCLQLHTKGGVPDSFRRPLAQTAQGGGASPPPGLTGLGAQAGLKLPDVLVVAAVLEHERVSHG